MEECRPQLESGAGSGELRGDNGGRRRAVMQTAVRVAGGQSLG